MVNGAILSAVPLPYVWPVDGSAEGPTSVEEELDRVHLAGERLSWRPMEPGQHQHHALRRRHGQRPPPTAVCLSVYVRLYVCLSVCKFVYQSVCLSDMSVCMSVCLYTQIL